MTSSKKRKFTMYILKWNSDLLEERRPVILGLRCNKFSHTLKKSLYFFISKYQKLYHSVTCVLRNLKKYFHTMRNPLLCVTNIIYIVCALASICTLWHDSLWLTDCFLLFTRFVSFVSCVCVLSFECFSLFYFVWPLRPLLYLRTSDLANSITPARIPDFCDRTEYWTLASLYWTWLAKWTSASIAI